MSDLANHLFDSKAHNMAKILGTRSLYTRTLKYNREDLYKSNSALCIMLSS